MSPSGALALDGGTPVLTREAHRVWPLVGEDERRAVTRVLDRGILSGPFAPESVALEREFAEYVGARHCLLTHCGTSALVVALSAAGVRAGDEVVVPAYSFVATPLAVVQVGAIPVFADVDAETGCLDPASAAAAVTQRTRAIMPVHMHGCAADLAGLGQVARRHGLTLVEDAAQAHGATFEGRRVDRLSVRRLVEERLARHPELAVILVADKETPAELLVGVMDEAQLGGAKRIAIASRKEQP